MMQETIQRRCFKAQFSSLTDVFKMSPGRDGRNCIIVHWLQPIKDHSEAVLAAEQSLAVFQIKKKEYLVDRRVLKNWETGWLLLNSRPEDLKDYVRMKEEMKDLHIRLKKMNAAERFAAEEDYRRYRELEGRCEKLLQAKVMLERCREQVRD
jgi:hypothetical protein